MILTGPFLRSDVLALFAEELNDLEKLRKATENRLRQITRTETDKDGVQRGLGMPEDLPIVARHVDILDGVRTLERRAVRNLEQVMKTHPLGGWVSAQQGLGLKTVARLLAVVGDPYWNTCYDRPRTVGELWSYCGVGDASAQRRVKGQKCNWNTEARTRLWVCVGPIVQNRRSPYRAVYDAAKAQYSAAVHGDDCKQCGSKGKPAPAGSALSKAHVAARAERAVMKAVLVDLYVEAKRLHTEPRDKAA